MKVKVIKTSQAINFEVVSEQPITEEDAANLQTSKGYAVAGYGFNNFRWSVDSNTDRIVTKWSCYTSCD